MRKYVASFASLPKSPLNLSVPDKLAKLFRERAKENRVKPNELATYMICEILGQDPTDFGLFPLVEQGQDADRDDR